MLQIKNSRQIVIGFIIFSIIFFIYSDWIVEWVSGFNPVVILFLSTLMNPIYIIFILALFESYGFRGMVAGFLISTASDLISLPHIYTKTGELSTISHTLITDSTFWNLVPEFFKFRIDGFNFGIFLIYVVASSGLVILALMITHKKKFKEIFLRAA